MIVSPLRYPGGKAKMFPYFSDLISENGLYNKMYCEPYAGGAGLAIRLLTSGYVNSVSLNDIDPAIFAFWNGVFNDTDAFCEKILATDITIDEWHRQQRILADANSDPLAVGFAAYFLNRTNRSGIIEGAGPIGGYLQEGEWKLDVRFPKQKQIENIKSLASFRGNVELSCVDAVQYISERIVSDENFIYLDPPYYVKGRKLYKNFYKHDDHQQIAQLVKGHMNAVWVVSYDDVSAIRGLYEPLKPITYGLSYSAGAKGRGSEVMYMSAPLKLPSQSKFAFAA